MSTITTRAGKGSPLTNTELDSNFTNLNTDKIENVVEDTTPQLGGDLSTNGNDINFGDNDKAIFGAGSDLQIYHDGDNSYIKDAGTGNLLIQAETSLVLEAPNGQNYLTANKDGNVALYYAGINKLYTTATGVNVLGTVKADGLTVDGNFTTTLTGNDISFERAGASYIRQAGGGTLFLSTNDGVSDKVRLEIQKDGDISFYEDTGTTPKLTWDASAQSLNVDGPITSDGLTVDGNLGIGTSSPARALDVSKSGSTILANFKNTGGTTSHITLGNTVSTADQIRVGSNGTALTLSTNYAERARIDSSGNLLVGKTTTDTNTVGHSLLPNGSAYHIRDGGTCGIFNRKTSNGDIVGFQKDGSTVGSIGISGAAFEVNAGSGQYLVLNNELQFLASNYTSVPRLEGADDDTISLGYSNKRFKDLYLSGGVKWANYTFVEEGGYLYVYNGSTKIMRVDSSGNAAFAGDVEANATL